MTKKETELLKTNSNYTLRTLRLCETRDLYNQALTQARGKYESALLFGITLGYTLGYARAERQTKNKQKKQQG